MAVIVTGTGRCGSSAVARVLHEQLGVHMGERFDRIRPPNPEGTYEDLDFRDLHVALGRGELERAEFEERARELITARTAEHGERWGFKDPRACYVLDFYLDELPDALVVIPARDPAEIATSIHRHYGTSVEEARRETDRRWSTILRALPDLGDTEPAYAPIVRGRTLLLDMRERRSDAWISWTLASAMLSRAGAALEKSVSW